MGIWSVPWSHERPSKKKQTILLRDIMPGMRDIFGRPQYAVSKAHFKSVCDTELDSIKVAIKRKSNGSLVEDEYFMEHFERLKRFFLNNFVEK
jgi:hypothetical protein